MIFYMTDLPQIVSLVLQHSFSSVFGKHQGCKNSRSLNEHQRDCKYGAPKGLKYYFQIIGD